MGNACVVCSKSTGLNCALCKASFCSGCMEINANYNDVTREWKVISSMCLLCGSVSTPKQWKKWVYFYFSIGLECDVPILEALCVKKLDRKSRLYKHPPERIARLIETLNEKQAAKRQKIENIHPITHLCFPGESGKVEAVFKIEDNIKSMYLDMTPIGGANLGKLFTGDPDCPDECFILSFLLYREVVSGDEPTNFGYPDQQKRYVEFKKANIELLRDCVAKKIRWEYVGRVVGGVYAPPCPET